MSDDEELSSGDEEPSSKDEDSSSEDEESPNDKTGDEDQEDAMRDDLLSGDDEVDVCNYHLLTIDELIQKCKEKGIKANKRYKRDTLIKKLQDNDNWKNQSYYQLCNISLLCAQLNLQ